MKLFVTHEHHDKDTFILECSPMATVALETNGRKTSHTCKSSATRAHMSEGSEHMHTFFSCCLDNHLFWA